MCVYQGEQEMRILLVEDHEPSLKIESALLKELGFDCDIARNGSEALQLFTSHHYPVVIMDIQIPELDGLETARRMRDIESTDKNAQKFTPANIIGMTGNATEDDRILCLAAGMNDYLSKPFRLDDLEEKLGLVAQAV